MASVADTPRRARKYAEETGESLAAQIEGVRDYIESLSASLGRMGGRQAGRARRTALKASHEADTAIHANPYAAIGVAVALGFLAGVLCRR